ncbi:hypothetical protein JCM10450v2_002850 [Rhodotorula kratochvilovae]
MPPRPLRVLGLPGFAENKETLETKLAPMREAFGGEIEVVCMDPTYPLPSRPGQPAPSPPLRCWNRWSSHFLFRAGELEHTLRHVRAFLRAEGPFDALLGFSQGGSIAVLLAALMERPGLHPAWEEDGPVREGVQAVVLLSGYGPGDPEYVRWFDAADGGGKVRVKSLHLIGRNDTTTDPRYSLDTVARFEHAKIVWHDCGHAIPQDPAHAQLIKDFLLSSCRPDLAVAAPRPRPALDITGDEGNAKVGKADEGSAFFAETGLRQARAVRARL